MLYLMSVSPAQTVPEISANEGSTSPSIASYVGDSNYNNNNIVNQRQLTLALSVVVSGLLRIIFAVVIILCPVMFNIFSVGRFRFVINLRLSDCDIVLR